MLETKCAENKRVIQKQQFSWWEKLTPCIIRFVHANKVSPRARVMMHSSSSLLGLSVDIPVLKVYYKRIEVEDAKIDPHQHPIFPEFCPRLLKIQPLQEPVDDDSLIFRVPIVLDRKYHGTFQLGFNWNSIKNSKILYLFSSASCQKNECWHVLGLL